MWLLDLLGQDIISTGLIDPARNLDKNGRVLSPSALGLC